MAAHHRIVSEYSPEFHTSPGFKVLDLFCCSGVSAEGYLRHGVQVVGVDKYRPTFYPAHFLEQDVFSLSIEFLRQFDFVHASPTCQGYSRTKTLHSNKRGYDLDMISQVRSLLELSGVPSVIENVIEAPLRKDFVLCGSMFGLQVMRHRAFECVGWVPFHSGLFCNHNRFKSGPVLAAGESGGNKHIIAEALGTYPCRTRWELCQGVPPAYTQYILSCYFFSVNKSPGKSLAAAATPPSALPVEGNKPICP